MAATTVSTVSAVQAAFVTAAKLEVPAGVTVWRTWPGQQATQRMVFFTEVEWTNTQEASIKAGRRNRDEAYNATFEVWHLVQGSPDGGGEAVDAAMDVYDACEKSIVQAGSSVRAVDGVWSVVCQPTRLELVAFESGWGAVITGRLSVQARLT